MPNLIKEPFDLFGHKEKAYLVCYVRQAERAKAAVSMAKQLRFLGEDDMAESKIQYARSAASSARSWFQAYKDARQLGEI